MGSGIVLQMIWMILVVVAVLLYMFTEYLVWKTACIIILSCIPVFLFLLPEGFIPVAESSVEERMYIVMISLVMLAFVFWDHICTLLKTEQTKQPIKNMLGMLLLLPKSIVLLYSFYMVLVGGIIVSLILWFIIMSVFLRQYAAIIIPLLKQGKRAYFLEEYRKAGISVKILLPFVVSDIAIVCCFIANSESGLLCALLLLYSELWFFVSHMCYLLEAKGQVLYEMLLGIMVLLIFGIVIACNFFTKTNEILLWVAKLAFGIAIPGLLLGFSIKRICK